MNGSSSCEQFYCATRSPELTTINKLLDLPPLPQTNRGVWVDRCLEANAICLGERVGVRGNDRCRRNMRASRSLGITIRNWRIAGSRTVRLAPSPRPSPPRKTTATLLELGTRFLVVFPGGEGATDATLLKAATRANLPSTITFSSAQPRPLMVTLQTSRLGKLGFAKT